MSRRKSYQIRVDEDTKTMLDRIRRKFSYNTCIHLLIKDKEKYDRYQLCSKLIHSVDGMKIDWISAIDKIIEYQEKHKD